MAHSWCKRAHLCLLPHKVRLQLTAAARAAISGLRWDPRERRHTETSHSGKLQAETGKMESRSVYSIRHRVLSPWPVHSPFGRSKRVLLLNPDDEVLHAHRILYSTLYSTLLEVALLRAKKWSVSFAGGRRSSHRFPTVAIRRSLLQTFGAQLRNINRC